MVSKGSTEWGHGVVCCSDLCGRRLGMRFRNGLADKNKYATYCMTFDLHDNEERIKSLRIRIKILEHKI